MEIAEFQKVSESQFEADLKNLLDMDGFYQKKEQKRNI